MTSVSRSSESDGTSEPRGVGAGHAKDDHGQDAGDAVVEDQSEADEAAENEGSSDSADRGGRERPPGDRRLARPQTSSTCRSFAAPVTVPEKRWLNRNRVFGWRFLRAAAAAQLMRLKTPPGPVAAPIATR